MKANDVRRVGIIGTGMIGTSLAVLLTGHGYPVTLLAMSQELADQSEKKYDFLYREIIRQNIITEEQAAICKRYLHYTTDWADLAEANYIWECVVEIPDVKWSVYREVERWCPNVDVLMSATSGISPDELVKGCQRYQDHFIINHPTNPPHLVPYTEIIPSTTTSSVPGLLEKTMHFSSSLSLKPVRIGKITPGFVTNRLQMAMVREIFQMVEDGVAEPRDIDTAVMNGLIPTGLTTAGFFEILDYIGLETVVEEADQIFPTLCNATAAPNTLIEKRAAGHLGIKSGQGFYDWTNVDLDAFSSRIASPWWSLLRWDLPTE